MGDVVIIQRADIIVLKGETRAGDDMRTLLVGCVNRQEDVNALEKQLIEVATNIKNTAKEWRELSVFSNIISILRLRKLLECCFIDSGVNVIICAGRERNVGHLDVERKGDNPNLDAPQQEESEKYRENTRRKVKWKNRKETVIVKAEGQTYADILKTVKDGVDIKDIGVEIIAIRKTKADDLMIQVKGGENKAKILKEAIIGKVDGVTAVYQKEMTVMHIRDLEEGTVDSDVKQGVKAALGDVSVEEMFVTSIRPAHSNTKNATVKIPKQWAKRLADRRRIRIGWVSCRIQIRMEDHRCYKCWERGHTARNCRGPDRSALCFNCEKEGHKKKDCKESQSSTLMLGLKTRIGASSPVNTTVLRTGELATQYASDSA